MKAEETPFVENAIAASGWQGGYFKYENLQKSAACWPKLQGSTSSAAATARDLDGNIIMM